MKTTTLLTAAILLAAPMFSHAQDSRGDNVFGGRKIAQILGGACPSMINQIMTRLPLKSALNSRPVKADEVCQCTEARFVADTRLQDYLTAEKSVLSERLNSPHLKEYFMLRFTQSALSCLASDLELSIEATSPEK